MITFRLPTRGQECVGPPEYGTERCRLLDGKELRQPKLIYSVNDEGQAISLVQVEVKSPRDNLPLTDGWSVNIPFNIELGTVVDASRFSLLRKRVDRHYYIRQSVTEKVLVNSQENIVFRQPETESHQQGLGGYPSSPMMNDLREDGSSTTGEQ